MMRTTNLIVARYSYYMKMPKLLLVDGDAVRARVLAAHLISGGYNVRIATSVERAISVAGVHFDLTPENWIVFV